MALEPENADGTVSATDLNSMSEITPPVYTRCVELQNALSLIQPRDHTLISATQAYLQLLSDAYVTLGKGNTHLKLPDDQNLIKDSSDRILQIIANSLPDPSRMSEEMFQFLFHLDRVLEMYVAGGLSGGIYSLTRKKAISVLNRYKNNERSADINLSSVYPGGARLVDIVSNL